MKHFYILLLLLGTAVYSQWSADPSQNTRVTDGGLLPQMISDGSGGAFIVYQDSPALLRQVWVQRLDRFGYVQFSENGTRISSADRYQTPYYYLVSDSLGGVIVLFEELHGNANSHQNYDAIYAQRIDSSGTKLWGDAGIELSPYVEGRQKAAISACSDSENGALVFWTEDADSNGVYELRAQRITSDGRLVWADSGIVVTNNFVFNHRTNRNPAVNVGGGHTIIFYAENSGENLKLQKLNGKGEFLWNDGVDIYSLGRLLRCNICDNNKGGAIVSGVRREFDGVSVKHIMRAQRISSDGQTLWGEKGITITEKTDEQTHYPEIACDIGSNTYFVWRDRRSGDFNVYSQKLNLFGTPLWETDGITISEFESRKSISDNGIASLLDGSNILIWRDMRIEGGGLYGQKLDSTGIRVWDKSDIPISIRNDHQKAHKVISVFDGGAITCWYEIGTGSGWGIFAQQVSRNGNLGEVLTTSVSQPQKLSLPSQYTLHQSYPNPFNGEMVIRYEIPTSNYVTLKIYDVTGKEVKTLVNKNQLPGVYRVKWNGISKKGGNMASGIYLYQLCAGNYVKNRKAILVK
jgi:hypothetical protein